MHEEHQHGGATCKCQPTAAVQSLDEMEFERGIWTAGKLLLTTKLPVIKLFKQYRYYRSHKML